MKIFALMQSGFVFWVLLGGAIGWLWPETLSAGRAWIPEALSLIMLGMGLTLTIEQVKVLRHGGKLLLLGVILQFLVMPLAGWALANLFGLSAAMATGVILVGAAPGGTASNVVTFLAKGDTALSIAMTALSTLLSPVLTPLWVFVLASQWIEVDAMALLWSVSKIVLIPVVIGIALRAFWTPQRWLLEGLFPTLAMLTIAWIVGVIVALNAGRLSTAALVLAVVVLHNGIGLGLGYVAAGKFQRTTAAQQRTIAIEVGMQNSGLAVALAIAHFEPAAAIPGAIFSLWHNVSGPVLASWWRRRQTGATAPSHLSTPRV